ncbi:LytTR family transcriptional regulator [Rheinheimera riviphila]|uniref:LytTR family transcriptional regulator n=1 Tax=Rheinheimera riviphila TaxID=1834037 RepID=A0A437QGB5_9GAMM|nr:LytTR family DNA-binding domain-containing protein [Rheinheimera riviphila]RVU33380.1 LytTR family transcriptional regulator [Rheinheimera riviphila]
MQTSDPAKLRFSRYGAGTLLLLFVACLWLVLRQPMTPPQLQPLEIAAWCDGQQVQTMPTDFREVGCQQQNEVTADPQHRLLWLQLPFELPFEKNQQSTSPAAVEAAPPQALFISARASSAVYLNGQLIGRNGRPGLAADEVPGAMDSRFYLPASLLRPGHNQLVLQMSAQHGWLTLAQPIHFIGIGPYSDANAHLQRHSELGLVLLGILLTGLLYFSVLALRSQHSGPFVDTNSSTMPRRWQDTLLALLCFFAAGQLWLEMVRGLVGYLYPLHDLRLLAILFCACGFGCCLLLLTALRYQRAQWHYWLTATVLLTLPVLVWLDSFDARIAVATLLPICIAALLATLRWRIADKQEDPAADGAGSSALLLLLYVLLAVLLTGIFQEILAFVLLTLLLCALFIEQAVQHQHQQQLQLADQQLIQQLQLQLQQHRVPEPTANLTLASAGKVQLLPVDEIAYCQAARDYSEIWLLDGRQQLYSGTLRALEEQLPARFIRVHRSYLVNVRHVRQFRTTTDADSGSGAVLLLASGQQVPVSRRLIPAVRSAMQEVVAA